MSGQSVVQTGSRKVSTTTWPADRASVTRRPCWSTSEKPHAGVSRGSGVPLIASVEDRVGVRVRRRERHRRGADEHDDRRRSSAAATWSRYGGDARGRARRVDAASWRAGRRRLGGCGRAHDREVAAATSRSDDRQHRVGVGADAAEEPEVLDEHPVREAEDDADDDTDANEPAIAGQQARRRSTRSATTTTRLTRPAVRGVEVAEGRTQPRASDVDGCGVWAICCTIAVSEPGCRVRRRPAPPTCPAPATPGAPPSRRRTRRAAGAASDRAPPVRHAASGSARSTPATT